MLRESLVPFRFAHNYRGFYFTRDEHGWSFAYGIGRVSNASLCGLRRIVDSILSGGAQ